ncbi:hypothetical protein [Paraburkholderia antibiotica]|uniref:Uncharacterized protein n=1 Tax=Paraburkholderia antibiotica TaxID=2728839 RepID=A0A7X9ZWB9_9BURK|nr:hypothetical protein [Paraburkholderia antibiotica]NML29425.1 hypothetical protein [Paraburkholderia antibiotica]
MDRLLAGEPVLGARSRARTHSLHSLHSLDSVNSAVSASPGKRATNPPLPECRSH